MPSWIFFFFFKIYKLTFSHILKSKWQLSLHHQKKEGKKKKEKEMKQKQLNWFKVILMMLRMEVSVKLARKQTGRMYQIITDNGIILTSDSSLWLNILLTNTGWHSNWDKQHSPVSSLANTVFVNKQRNTAFVNKQRNIAFVEREREREREREATLSLEKYSSCWQKKIPLSFIDLTMSSCE